MSSSFVDGLLLTAAVLTAAVSILAALWWLVRPRVDRYLGRLVESSERATRGCTERLEAVADRLDAHDDRLRGLESTRSAVAFDELVDLVEVVMANRPKPPDWPPPRKGSSND